MLFVFFKINKNLKDIFMPTVVATL